MLRLGILFVLTRKTFIDILKIDTKIKTYQSFFIIHKNMVVRANRVITKLKEKSYDRLIKGVWGMPRLSEAKKDVISCEKLRGSAHMI